MTPVHTVGSSQLQQMQQAMFARADLDADGQLSLDEFQTIGQNLPEPGSSGAARTLRGGGCGCENFTAATMGSLLSLQEDRAAGIFSGADADGDGTLTADELAADMAAHAPPGLSGETDASAMAADLVARADADGDGLLSLEEFSAAAPPPPPPGARGGGPVGDETASTDPLDTNGDGQVSMSELLASLQASSEATSGFTADASDLLARLIEQLTAETTASTASLAA